MSTLLPALASKLSPSPVRRLPAATVPRPTPPRRPIERLKTVIEYPLALGLFLAALPVMAAAMLATRWLSAGPAIYSQRRVGRAGRVFTIYKIRTMHHDCESLTGPRWAIPGDPRITPLGAILRTLHIDELPQLWNVLRGDMSLIGPRPERPEIVTELATVVPGYHARHTIRPGITGYAQIHLPPDSSLQSVRNKVAYDRFYIQNLGAKYDCYIYFCTLLKVLGLKRIYVRPPRRGDAL